MLDYVKRHPWLTALMVACVAGGAVLGALFLDPEWTLGRRIAGGAIGGAGVGLILLMNRMLGAYREKEIDVRQQDGGPPEEGE